MSVRTSSAGRKPSRQRRASAVRPAFVYPVILEVAADIREAAPGRRARRLSRLARRALEISAQRCGLKLGKLRKDPTGSPLPSRGVFWSLTHKPAYVGGVVAVEPIGIDIERVRPLAPALWRRVASEPEWRLIDPAAERTPVLFFRVWTAKEAVLKAGGIGLRELSRCRLASVSGPHHLAIRYRDRLWPVEHRYFDRHLAALVLPAAPVHWIRLSQSSAPSAV